MADIFNPRRVRPPNRLRLHAGALCEHSRMVDRLRRLDPARQGCVGCLWNCGSVEPIGVAEILTTECTECTEWGNWKRDQKAEIGNQRIIASLYPRNLWSKWHGDWIPCILCNLWLRWLVGRRFDHGVHGMHRVGDEMNGRRAEIGRSCIKCGLYPCNLWSTWLGDWNPCILCNLWLRWLVGRRFDHGVHGMHRVGEYCSKGF